MARGCKIFSIMKAERKQCTEKDKEHGGELKSGTDIESVARDRALDADATDYAAYADDDS
jgi:hypothetical protein